MVKSAVVTGASSGVGQSIAIKLAQAGHNVAIVSRREAELKKTVVLAGDAGARMLVVPCDISDYDAVQAMAGTVLERFGTVHVLVNAAGTNTPDRSLQVLSLKTYRQVMDINLGGSFFCVQAFLAKMRQQKEGTIVNIVSDAGLLASPKAGAAYVMSKFALRGLTQSINAEERGNGIRACAILPGDIDTPLLNNRPTPPAAEARALMLRSEDVAECAMLAINLPPRAIVEELLVRPR